MPSIHLRAVLAYLAALLLCLPVWAEVVIVAASGERVSFKADAPADLTDVPPVQLSGGFGTLHGSSTFDSPAGGMPEPETWLFPWTIDDSTVESNSTLISIRHQENTAAPIQVTIEYRDTQNAFITNRMIMVERNEIVPINVNSVAELINPGDVALGIGQIVANGSVSVDFFQVDADDDFAFGSVGAQLEEDFCDSFTARFLRFPGTTGGTELTILVNGPLGNDDGVNPPTLTLELFTQSGDPIGGPLDVFTDEWLFTLDPQAFTGGVSFGSMRISIDSTFSPAGIILERHSAFGEFSVGLPSYCTDLDV